jgi:biotin synthase-like enzyme
VCQILQILLKKFAYGFELQKGAIFGFGEKKEDETGTVLKISEVSQEKLEHLVIKFKYIILVRSAVSVLSTTS